MNITNIFFLTKRFKFGDILTVLNGLLLLAYIVSRGDVTIGFTVVAVIIAAANLVELYRNRHKYFK